MSAANSSCWRRLKPGLQSKRRRVGQEREDRRDYQALARAMAYYVVSAYVWGEEIDDAADSGPEAVDGSLGGLAQERLELGDGVLDRIEGGPSRAAGRGGWQWRSLFSLAISARSKERFQRRD